MTNAFSAVIYEQNRCSFGGFSFPVQGAAKARALDSSDLRPRQKVDVGNAPALASWQASNPPATIILDFPPLEPGGLNIAHLSSCDNRTDRPKDAEEDASEPFFRFLPGHGTEEGAGKDNPANAFLLDTEKAWNDAVALNMLDSISEISFYNSPVLLRRCSTQACKIKSRKQ
ncbi:MAG: hypothetical protein OIF40_04575 [Mangrovicoccus sp.]|nr:hypothetical protein [Mangrovicoccus sp.]